MTQRSSAELIITIAGSALGLCSSNYITQLWLTGDTAYDRPSDTVLKRAGEVVSLSCILYVVRELRTADRLACQSSSPRALKAQGSFPSHQGLVSFRSLTLTHTFTHKHTHWYCSAIVKRGEESSTWTHMCLRLCFTRMCVNIWFLHQNQHCRRASTRA